ncbi:hypothetical protein [Pseudomonas entomophila]|nr:hypothetical protein [Pseudomonas entomophila]MCG8293718.1 hypothetical protein [Pseudomonas entomophila]
MSSILVTDTNSAAVLLSFNTEHYARVREDVANRLGDLTRRNVSEYEI